MTGACGFNVPQIEERWEPVSITDPMEYRIKAHIFCELVEAINNVNQSSYTARTADNAPPPTKGSPLIPDDYSVQMQLTLTVDENTAVNPGITYNNTLANANVAGVTVGRMFNLGVGGTFSSDALRTDTSYTFFKVGKIKSNKDFCDKVKKEPVSSSFLQSRLGIEDYLYEAVKGNDVLHSSQLPKSKKDVKVDVFSYEVKFVVVTNGNINPVWKLVSISANSGTLPLFSTGRTRTHDLILTFGPTGPNGYEPSAIAQNQLYNSQLNSTLQRLQGIPAAF